MYQGGGDLWKIYNFDFERSKMLNVFDSAVDLGKDIRQKVLKT